MKNRIVMMIIGILSILNHTVFCEVYYPGSQKGLSNLAHWANHHVDWYLHINGAGDNFSYDSTKNLILNAYNSWRDVSASDITFSYINSINGTYDDGDYINGHYWVYDGDPYFGEGQPFYDGQGGINASAVTNVHFDNITYEMIDMDIVYNGEKTWYNVSTQWNDIQSVALHEIGHQIGLAPSNVAYDYLSVMKEPNDPANSNRRVLKFDDEKGASFLIWWKSN